MFDGVGSAFGREGRVDGNLNLCGTSDGEGPVVGHLMSGVKANWAQGIGLKDEG